MKQLQNSNLKKFLIIRPDQIGDLTMIIPALVLLREKYPDAHFTLLAQTQTVDLARSLPWINAVWIDPIRSQNLSGRRALRKYAAYIREQQFDCSIHFLNSYPYAYLAWKAGIPRRIGFTSSPLFSWMYTDRVSHNTRDITRHEVDQNIELIESLLASPPSRPTEIVIPSATLDPHYENIRGKLAARGLSPTEKYAVIHLSAGKGNKSWLPERIGELAKRVRDKYYLKVIVTGGPADVETGKKLAQLDPLLISMAGETTLSDLMAIISHATFYVGSDTGPTHLATLFGRPVVALFPSKVSEPAHWGPWNSPNVVVRPLTRCTLNCRPAQCPFFYCAEDIPVEEVLNAIARVMNGKVHIQESLEAQQVAHLQKTLRILLVDTDHIDGKRAMESFREKLDRNGFAVFKAERGNYREAFIRYGINIVHAMPPISWKLAWACLSAGLWVHKSPQLIQGVPTENGNDDFARNYMDYLQKASTSWTGKIPREARG